MTSRAARSLLLILPAALAAARPGSAREPLDLIPSDILICWKGLPFSETTQAPTQPAAIDVLVETGRRIFRHRLDKRAQLTLRIFEGLGTLARYPFAVALIDARARPVGQDRQGSKVDRLQIAAVVKTGGQNQPLLRLIKLALDEQTDAGVATLEKKQAGRWTYQELRDERLPGWCVVAWGALDEHFVITLGDGVWPLVASVAQGKQDSASRDAWIAGIRRQYPQEPLIEIILAARGIRERLDPFVQGRASEFFKAWQASGLERGYWALGFEGRALYCFGHLQTGERTIRRRYADPRIRAARFLQTVPDETRYAVFRLEIPTYLPRLISGFYATRSAEERRAAVELWTRLQRRLGIDAERDGLAHLGNTIVMHNCPAHPLHLPLAFTSLIEIRREPEKVRHTLETLCAAWQRAMEEAADQSGVYNPARLERDDDGIWYLQIGPVASLAWTFTDRFIVTSWSPWALRQYLDTIGDKAGRRLPADN